MESRRFHRVTFAAPGELCHQGMSYRIRLENISMRGALISSHECIMVPADDCATLLIQLDQDAELLAVTVRVVHSFFSMVGVEFVAIEAEAGDVLFHLLERITDQPEKLLQERQELQELEAAQAAQAELPKQALAH